MPRNAKRNPAAPSAMPATSPGQSYGVGGDQKAALAQLPMAEGEQLGTQVPIDEAQAPSAVTAAQPAAAALSPDDAALAMAPPPEGGALEADTAFPDEPFSAGMSIGDGPGPEVVPLLSNQSGRVGPVAATLAAIAAATGGDPRIQQLADRAAARRV